MPPPGDTGRPRLEAILQQMPIGVLIAEIPTGRLLFCNDACHRLFDGQPPWTDVVKTYRSEPPCRMDGSPYAPGDDPVGRAVTSGEAVTQEEVMFTRDDGSWRLVGIHAGPIREADGQARAAVIALVDDTPRKEAEAALQALNERLEMKVEARTRQVRALASALTLAEQRERHRIAQILHDDLQQLLFGAQIKLRILDELMQDAGGEKAAQVLEQVTAVLRRAAKVARTLTVDLSPPVLEGEGLVEAINWLGAQMQETHDLTVAFDTVGPLLVPHKEMRVLLFNLVRELLFNVALHAGVKEARVEARQDERYLRLKVEDQGRGFDPHHLSRSRPFGKGFGLFGVRERLDLFDGRLEIESAPGRGTCATIIVPFSASSPVAHTG